ncbi:MAG: 3-hydroxy-5-phosphonooxypentane-2,4-dione thiolase LsrF [Nitrospinota bacterium]|nr:3-hydroxy-5-phosphonooxypentane-2,4-dione thiolase LsrF [Nitrospinota bacterium]
MTNLLKDNGKMVMLALDHGYFQGPTSGLEDPKETLEKLIPFCDAVSPTKGIFLHCMPKEVNVPVILRASGGNSIVYADPLELEREVSLRSLGNVEMNRDEIRKEIDGQIVDRELSNEGITVSCEEAKSLGVEGVSISIYVGTRYQKESILNLSKMSEGTRNNGLELLGITAVGKEMKRDARYLGLASRIAAEHGADIVKTYYCDDFQKVVNGCFVPIVIAGGKKIPEEDALDLCYRAISDGAVGVDMGRNIFQSRFPVAMMKAVGAVVHKGVKPDVALELFKDESSS